MSNSKEGACLDTKKFRLSVTVELTDSFSDLLQEESQELEKYIGELVSTNKEIQNIYACCVGVN